VISAIILCFQALPKGLGSMRFPSLCTSSASLLVFARPRLRFGPSLKGTLQKSLTRFAKHLQTSETSHFALHTKVKPPELRALNFNFRNVQHNHKSQSNHPPRKQVLTHSWCNLKRRQMRQGLEFKEARSESCLPGQVVSKRRIQFA
jgi:hypothetical protein